MRVLERPLRNVGCSTVLRDEMKTIDNHRRFLQLAQKVTFAPWDWYLTLNLLRYLPWLSLKEGQRLIYVMSNHPYAQGEWFSLKSYRRLRAAPQETQSAFPDLAKRTSSFHPENVALGRVC